MSYPSWMSAAVLEAKKNGFEDLEKMIENLPSVGEQTAESITDNTILINNQCQDPRMKFVMERLVYHLHTFFKEVNLQTEEWMAAIRFLGQMGQNETSLGQELILLSDVLGLSTLVNTLSSHKPPGFTETTILGPFHTDDAPQTEAGGSIVSSNGGKKLMVSGVVKDKNGKGISGAQLDVWETDQDGFYDVQRTERKGPDNRGLITTDESGKYRFEAIVPVPYPIPVDGAVGSLLKKLNRHCFRPAHLHFMIKANGYEPLITTLYIKGDPFVNSDAVFAVKDSLIVDISRHDPEGPRSTPWWSLCYDFALPTTQEAHEFKLSQQSKTCLVSSVEKS